MGLPDARSTSDVEDAQVTQGLEGVARWEVVGTKLMTHEPALVFLVVAHPDRVESSLQAPRHSNLGAQSARGKRKHPGKGGEELYAVRYGEPFGPITHGGGQTCT